MRWLPTSGGRRCLLLAVVLAAIASPASQTPSSGTTSLSVEEVVKLKKDGISDDLIVAKIKQNGRPFDLSSDEITELEKLGISDLLIHYMLDPKYTPPPPPAPAPPPSKPEPSAPPPAPPPPVKQYPADKYASKVPPDPGLYRFPAEQPAKVDVQVLLGTQEGGGLGKVLKMKGKVLAYLVGPAAKTRINDPSPSFYMRLAEGKAIEDIVLVALNRKSDRRDFEVGPPGPKQEIKPEARRPFDCLEVGHSLFKLTPAKLTKGEYLFFQLGSAEKDKGSLGKGFDFGIDERK